MFNFKKNKKELEEIQKELRLHYYITQEFESLKDSFKRLKQDYDLAIKKNNMYCGNVSQLFELIEQSENSKILKQILLVNGFIDFEKVNELYTLCIKIRYPPAP